ncbi:hypothetical protein [Streptomyces sp. NPDC002769]|uniref:hypothetical protein n=1 Tax=Streptomyces sp. NPDC002769 TaxID=3154542 RepID=UPI0033170016
MTCRRSVTPTPYTAYPEYAELILAGTLGGIGSRSISLSARSACGWRTSSVADRDIAECRFAELGRWFVHHGPQQLSGRRAERSPACPGHPPRHRLASYSAKHWHAQLGQLTGTRRGYEALDAAGLDVRPDTLIKWLSDLEYDVRRSYRDLIHTAYENVAIVPADPIPDTVKDGRFEISGLVKTGADERERGTRRAAPLRIDASRGD